MAGFVQRIENHAARPGDYPESATAVTASGILGTPAGDATDTEITVVEDTTYIVTCIGTRALLGFATTATEANVIYTLPADATRLVYVPVGTTTLHYQTTTASGSELRLSVLKK